MKHFVVTEQRNQKARKIEEIISDYTGAKVSNMSILDIGCGNGEISEYMRRGANSVFSVDIEDQRVNKKDENFTLVQSEHLPYSDNSFDLVLSNHIIEHVKDYKLHIDEIDRVLKQSGVVYMATPNRVFPYEFHYRVWFLHWLPPVVFWSFLKIMGKYQEHLTLQTPVKLKAELKKRFQVKNYTYDILKNPEKYYATDCVRMKHGKYLRFLIWASPTIVFTMRKK
jgi:2-polyprenyl-3-methyl-5-hydroxy-6-metoxy-1,4-benzoquinol methylase